MGLDSLGGLVYSGLITIVGDPIILGLIAFGTLMGLVVAQGQGRTAKLMTFIPASIIMAAFVPWVLVIAGLVAGGLLYLGIMRFISK